MNLQENIDRIKEVMSIQEQSNNKLGSMDFKRIQQPSDYLGKGGGFEKETNNGHTAQEYANILSNKKAEDIKKIRLIFPKSFWEETALKLVKKLGIITEVFTNLRSAVKFVKNLAKKGVKADEFVIGSHGSEGMLLFTKDEKDEYRFDNDFLNSFKSIIHPGTKVFFTACNGADYLDGLKDAAEKLGVGAYGSAGLYNYVSNSSEKGYYWCSPKGFTPPISKVKKPAYELKNNTIFITLLSGIRNKEINGTITIKDGVFDSKILPIPITGNLIEERKYNVSEVRDNYLYMLNYSISMHYEIQYATSSNNLKKGDTQKNNTFTRKTNELNGKNIFMGDYLEQKFKSNEISIYVEINGKKINIKSLPLISEPTEITNEFLLQEGLCKKIDRAPISWL
jgi:hypothetical protein